MNLHDFYLYKQNWNSMWDPELLPCSQLQQRNPWQNHQLNMPHSQDHENTHYQEGLRISHHQNVPSKEPDLYSYTLKALEIQRIRSSYSGSEIQNVPSKEPDSYSNYTDRPTSALKCDKRAGETHLLCLRGWSRRHMDAFVEGRAIVAVCPARGRVVNLAWARRRRSSGGRCATGQITKDHFI